MIGAAVLLPIAFLFGYMTLVEPAGQDPGVGEEQGKLLELEWKGTEQARADVDGLKDWEQTTVSWIDELYDISARFPHETGLRLSQVSAAPLARKAGASVKDKDGKYVGVETLHGVMQPDQDKLVSRFMNELRKDPHLRVTSPDFRGNEFTVRIEVAAQPGSAFTQKLEVPPQPKRTEPEKMPEPVVDPLGAETEDE